MGKLRYALRIAALILFVAPLAAHAQTDISASAYGTITTTGKAPTNLFPTANPTILNEEPSNAVGFMVGLRHIKSSLVGFEFTYSFNQANQKYSMATEQPCSTTSTGSCSPTLTIAELPANANEFAADWVVSMKKFAGFRPFVLAGAGAIITAPTSNSVDAEQTLCANGGQSQCQSTSFILATSSASTTAFVFGGGVDWMVLPHLGLRVQYRGNLYEAPNMITMLSEFSGLTLSSRPTAGLFFQF